MNTATGAISGTAAAFGSNFRDPVGDQCTFRTGTATLTFSIGVAPAITSSLAVTMTSGVASTYQIVATNGPTSYSNATRPAVRALD